MIGADKNIPLSTATLVFGALSIPLAFTRHLVSLGLLLGLLALVLGALGHWLGQRQGSSYSPGSMKRMAWALRLGSIGTVSSLVMWVLWASNVLLR